MFSCSYVTFTVTLLALLLCHLYIKTTEYRKLTLYKINISKENKFTINWFQKILEEYICILISLTTPITFYGLTYQDILLYSDCKGFGVFFILSEGMLIPISTRLKATFNLIKILKTFDSPNFFCFLNFHNFFYFKKRRSKIDFL